MVLGETVEQIEMVLKRLYNSKHPHLYFIQSYHPKRFFSKSQ